MTANKSPRGTEQADKRKKGEKKLILFSPEKAANQILTGGVSKGRHKAGVTGDILT